MGFRSSRRRRSEDNSDSSRQVTQQRGSTGWSNESQQESSGIWTNSIDRGEQHFGMTIPDQRTLQRLRMAEDTYGQQVHEWVDEGMPTEIMGKTRDMEAFRQRQAERPPEVPTNIERQNRRSVQRSKQAAAETGAAGETGAPESVRDVIASTGRSLDASIQRAMEDRMGDSFGDVQIHTGPTAASACESINARAFTVGNHIAFNAGEYDPNTAEGQHVLAHELAHVRQQTDGAVSLLPQEEVELEVDPDPALEREAEETAQRVMQGGELGIQRLPDTEVHIQRLPAELVPQALDMLKTENENGGIGSFQQDQNDDRIEFIESKVQWAINNAETHANALDTQNEKIRDAQAEGDEERVASLQEGKEAIQDRIGQLFDHIQDKADQIALTDEQREKLYGANDFDGGEAITELGWTTVKSLISLVPGMGQVIAVYEVGETALRQFWEQTEGSLGQRLAQVKEQIVSQSDTGNDSSKIDF